MEAIGDNAAQVGDIAWRHLLAALQLQGRHSHHLVYLHHAPARVPAISTVRSHHYAIFGWHGPPLSVQSSAGVSMSCVQNGC